MSVTVNFGSFVKKRNSTKQPTNELSDSRTVVFKESTSVDSPTFILTGNVFDYNYASWNDGTMTRYYFISDIRTVKNNLTEIDCVIDVLATYKTQILAGTHFVSYSSHNSNTWLPDTRIPLVNATKTARNTASLASLFNTVGFYVLTAVGKDGCVAYAMDKSTLDSLLDAISSWQNDGVDNAVALLQTHRGIDVNAQSFTVQSDDFTGLGNAITATLQGCMDALTATVANCQLQISNAVSGMGAAAVETGFIGNAYSLAPECIRSCIWVPFFASQFADTGKDLYLGNFPCKSGGSIMRPFTLKGSPVTGSVTVNIPWHYNDWRRGTCEDVYLYLPMVGMIQLSSSSLTNVSTLTIKYSATATDGVVCYEIKADSNVIGTYSGQCSANYPIGINQQASAGEIAQSVIGGITKTVSAATQSSLSPLSMGAAFAEGAINAASAGYETANVVNSTHLTTIGGIGGGAGSGLDLNVQCYTVCHETIMTPADMVATMGLPTMLPYPLANLTGYCQCANAHCEANAMAVELDAIDSYLNNGFFIE
jgi:hypothetical protein